MPRTRTGEIVQESVAGGSRGARKPQKCSIADERFLQQPGWPPMKDSFSGGDSAGRSPMDLPEMQPEVLDAAGLKQVFMVLAFETKVRGILLRGDGAGASSDETTLRDARDALERGEASGVQVHYVHDGVEWWDTVMRTEAGYRRVRIRKGPGSS